MTNVINQLLSPKYVSAKRISAGSIAFIGDGSFTSGAMCAAAKKRWDEHQTEIAGADILKSARWNSRCRFDNQNEITKPSSATITVPAAGPYSSTAVKTNVSEIEIDAYEDGSRTVA